MLISTKHLTIQRSSKLTTHFVSSFHVIHRIGAKSYELDLLVSFKVHPIFYLYLLKLSPLLLVVKWPLAIRTALLYQQKPI